VSGLIFPQFFLQSIYDRLEMRIAGSGADEKKVSKRGRAAQVDGDNIFRLFVSTNSGAGLGESFGVDGGESQWLGR